MTFLILFCAKYIIFIAAAYAVLHIYFLHERKHHIRHVVTVFGTAALSWAVGYFMKNIIAHPRPDLAHALLTPDDPYSFPSGHATFMFALAATMYAYDKRAGRILFLLAVIVGTARVLAGVHYWYDIVGGAFVGYLVSLVVMILFKRTIRSH